MKKIWLLAIVLCVVSILSCENVTTAKHHGELAEAPTNPIEGDIYFDTDDETTYIYTGERWISLTGKKGEDGKDGIGIIWKGELEDFPYNPELNWVYYHTINKKTYIYNGTEWQIFTQDGLDGKDGLNATITVDELPFDAENGSLYYLTTNKTLYLRVETYWKNISSGGFSGMGEPFAGDPWTNGDIYTDTLSGYVYRYSAGEWFSIGTIEYQSVGGIYLDYDYWQSIQYGNGVYDNYNNWLDLIASTYSSGESAALSGLKELGMLSWDYSFPYTTEIDYMKSAYVMDILSYEPTSYLYNVYIIETTSVPGWYIASWVSIWKAPSGSYYMVEKCWAYGV
jgi:hypothetical protein